MAPVFDFQTKGKVNYKNKANWLAEHITLNSTYNPLKVYDEKELK